MAEDRQDMDALSEGQQFENMVLAAMHATLSSAAIKALTARMPDSGIAGVEIERATLPTILFAKEILDNWPARDAAEGAVIGGTNFCGHGMMAALCPKCAPPKPVPDAVREAVQPFANLGGTPSAEDTNAGVHFTAFWDLPADTVIYHDNMGNCFTAGDVRNLRRVLSAPVPPASIHDAHDDIARGISYSEGEAGPVSDCASHKLFSEEKILGGLKDWIRETVPPADGARILRLEQTIRDSIERLERNSTSAPVVECLKAALSSPCVGAAEPVAEVEEFVSAGAALVEAFYRASAEKRKSVLAILTGAAPPVRGDREAIARTNLIRVSIQRVYDEMCIKFSGVHSDDQTDSWLLNLHYSLKLLSLPVQPGTDEWEAAELFQLIEDECWTLKCQSYPNTDDADIGWEVIEHHMAKPHERLVASGPSPLRAMREAAIARPLYAERARNTLSRQAPHSSSEDKQ